MCPERTTESVPPSAEPMQRAGSSYAFGREPVTRRSVKALQRRREQLRRHRALDLAWRIGVAVVGVAIILAGVAMLALPGPGWAAIFVGLAVLGSEFTWARRLLRWARRQAGKAAAAARDPRRRRRNRWLLAAGLVVLAAAAWWYLATYGVALPF